MRSLSVLACVLATTQVAAQSFDPPVAVDINPDPRIVEVNLTAAPTTWRYVPGRPTQVYAYNNSIPGPTIDANVGDTVIVHFTNNLPEATTIHWHGLDVPADMDGSHISQLHVPPGGTFDYQFSVNRAGMFWYHPHVRTFDQVERGLHGCFIVRDPRHQALLDANLQGGKAGPFTQHFEEHVIVFDDVLLDGNNQVVPSFSFTDPLQNAAYQLNGREGNVLLVNGKRAGRMLPVTNGNPQRWRIVNAANATVCRLDFHDPATGVGRTVWQIGEDGSLLERPVRRPAVRSTAVGAPGVSPGLITEMRQGVLLQPGQRMDIIFTPIGLFQTSFTVTQTDWRRGRQTASYGPGGSIALANDPMDGSYPKQPYIRLDVQPLFTLLSEYRPPNTLLPHPPQPGPSTGVLAVDFAHSSPDPQGNVTFLAQTGLSASRVTSFEAYDVFVGDVKTWEVTNRSTGDHPFHCHGFPFELLEFEFQDDLDPTNPALNFIWRPTRRVLLDTVRVPPRMGGRGTSRCIARLLTHFDDAGRVGRAAAHGQDPTFDSSGNYTSGGWLFHCHVLEHSGRGMASFLEVRDRGNPFHLLGQSTAGTTPKASLTARGSLLPGTVLGIDVVDARPLSPVALVLGIGSLRAPLFNGVLVPNPQVIVGNFTDAAGSATWGIPWGQFPSGIESFWQAAIIDPGAAPGVALSNALKFTTL